MAAEVFDADETADSAHAESAKRIDFRAVEGIGMVGSWHAECDRDGNICAARCVHTKVARSHSVHSLIAEFFEFYYLILFATMRRSLLRSLKQSYQTMVHANIMLTRIYSSNGQEIVCYFTRNTSVLVRVEHSCDTT